MSNIFKEGGTADKILMIVVCLAMAYCAYMVGWVIYSAITDLVGVPSC